MGKNRLLVAVAGHAPTRSPRTTAVRDAAVKAFTLVAVLGVLWACGRATAGRGCTSAGRARLVVDETTMPHLHDIVGALSDRLSTGELLIDYLFHAALFTAKEATVGFAIGAAVGFFLGAIIARFVVLQRGLMPYIVASRTIPILAIAPIVVVGLGSTSIAGWSPAAWQRVAVIAAYLTFFPMTVNTVRGLQSAEPAAVELMRSYAAGEWAVFWKLRVPSSLPYLFSAFRVAATASVVGAIIGELPSSIQEGLGGAILNFNQY
jgi:NitT/TauT family transport system permease protein